MKRDETLCWTCSNFGRCQWAKGKEVPGWDAKPTTIKNCDGSKLESFIVYSCPNYKKDKISLCTLDELAKMLNVSTCALISKLRRRPMDIFNQLKSQGIRLFRYGGDNCWYIENFSDKNKDKGIYE